MELTKDQMEMFGKSECFVYTLTRRTRLLSTYAEGKVHTLKFNGKPVGTAYIRGIQGGVQAVLEKELGAEQFEHIAAEARRKARSRKTKRSARKTR